MIASRPPFSTAQEGSAMRVKSLSVLLLAISLWPFAAAAQPVERMTVPIKPPLPFPADAAGYQWIYKCPAGKKCTIFLPGQSFDLATQAVVVLVMLPVGKAIIPSYFWWVTFQIAPERTGFLQNPASFTMSVSSEFRLDSAGPIGP
jgi:hypothetical protein